jgi:hypothetical protein
MAQILSSCIWRVLTHYCFLRFQSLTTPSTDAEASCKPELSHFTFISCSECPWRVATHSPFSPAMFQTFRSLSPLTVTIILSVGLNSRSQIPFMWPFSSVTSFNSFAVQIFTVLSWLPEAMSLSFGENLTQLMLF